MLNNTHSPLQSRIVGVNVGVLTLDANPDECRPPDVVVDVIFDAACNAAVLSSAIFTPRGISRDGSTKKHKKRIEIISTNVQNKHLSCLNHNRFDYHRLTTSYDVTFAAHLVGYPIVQIIVSSPQLLPSNTHKTIIYINIAQINIKPDFDLSLLLNFVAVVADSVLVDETFVSHEMQIAINYQDYYHNWHVSMVQQQDCALRNNNNKVNNETRIHNKPSFIACNFSVSACLRISSIFFGPVFFVRSSQLLVRISITSSIANLIRLGICFR
jgi:hypothetical protein